MVKVLNYLFSKNEGTIFNETIEINKINFFILLL